MQNLNNGNIVNFSNSESVQNTHVTNPNKIVNISQKVNLNNVKIVKKDGTIEEYNVQKVVNAVKKSAARMLVELTDEEIQNICNNVDKSVYEQRQDYIDISKMHCIVENALEDVNPKVAKQILSQFDIKCSSKILQIGGLAVKQLGSQVAKLDNSEYSQEQQTDKNLSTFQPFNPSTESDISTSDKIFHPEIDRIKALGDTIGGKFEVVFKNLPVGLGSFVHWDRMLDGKIAQCVMSIPAVKAVEIGENPLGYLGSEYHDEMFVENGKIIRKTNNAGGIEGGMTNGEPLVVKAVMKPIPTMKKPLKTVDLATLEECEAHFERSDTCAVEACSVVAEARIACILADEFLQKFAGDSLEEIVSRY